MSQFMTWNKSIKKLKEQFNKKIKELRKPKGTANWNRNTEIQNWKHRYCKIANVFSGKRSNFAHYLCSLLTNITNKAV